MLVRNLLFELCHLIGFHCLGGSGFSKCTIMGASNPLQQGGIHGNPGSRNHPSLQIIVL